MEGGSDARDGRRDAIAAAGLILASFAAYSNVFGHAFLLNWDDLGYVVENEAVQGLTWSNLRAAFSRFFLENYAPLQIVSYAIDHAVWGLRSGGFLFTNVLLHGINGALLYALLVRLAAGRGAALLGAAVFLLHPVQVESVAWISERKNLLCMTFFLASLHAYASYRGAASPRERGAWYAATSAACVAALLTKAVAVILPPLLLLFDHCLAEPVSWRRRLVDKLPLVAGCVAVALATLAGQAGAIAEGRAAFGMDGPTKLYTMTPIVADYLRMLAWPVGLSALYAPPIRAGPDLTFGLCAALLALVALAGVLLLRANRRLFFWYSAFFLGLGPVLQIVPLPSLMNDRYLYFPMIGVAGLLATLADGALRAGPGLRKATLAGAGALLCSLGVWSHARAEVWRDDLALWRDVVAKTPSSTLAWNGLGMSLVDSGHPDQGLGAFLKALEIDPHYRPALNNAGVQYNLRGEPELGRPYLLRAIQLAPDHFETYMNLGVGYRMSGDNASAARAFAAALSLRPGSPAATRELRDAQARLSQGGIAR